jgi:hypothetical protein
MAPPGPAAQPPASFDPAELPDGLIPSADNLPFSGERVPVVPNSYDRPTLPAPTLSAPQTPAPITPSSVTRPATGSNNATLVEDLRQQAMHGKTIDPSRPEYKMGVGGKILGSLTNFASGFSKNPSTVYVGPGATNARYSRDESMREQNLATDARNIAGQKTLDTEAEKQYEDALRQAYQGQVGEAREKAASAEQDKATTADRLADIRELATKNQFYEAQKQLEEQAKRNAEMFTLGKGNLDLKQQIGELALQLKQQQLENDNAKFATGTDAKSLEAERKSRLNAIEDDWKAHPYLNKLFGDKNEEIKSVNDDINTRLQVVGVGAAASPATGTTVPKTRSASPVVQLRTSHLISKAPPKTVTRPELSRADVAGYMDQANWSPEQAKNLAARDALSNLGVHPAVVAQATPPATPWMPRPVAAAPAPPATTAPKIDLSAGLVPKAPARRSTPAVPVPAGSAIDLSAGLVPKTANPSLPTNSYALSEAEGAPSYSADEVEEAPKPYQEPETTGAFHQIGGFLKGSGENVAGAIKGVHDLYRGPQNDEERALLESLKMTPYVGDRGQRDGFGVGVGVGEIAGRLALAGYRFLGGVNETLKQSDRAGEAGARAKASGEGVPGQILSDAEEEPFIGKAVKLSEQRKYGEALGDLLSSVLLMRGVPDQVGGLPKALGGKGLSSVKAAVPAVVEPIPGAPLTMGEAAGPGLRQGAEKLFAKTSTAEGRMGDVMRDRTAAVQRAAENAAPKTPSPETTGATLQDAARYVLDRQSQAQSLVSDFADRAQGEAGNTRAAAVERAGTESQQSAVEQLNARRTSDIEAGGATAKQLSGLEELPMPETDRGIISSLRGANADAKIEESAAHNDLAESAKTKGITVDTAPMQSVAREVVALEGPARDLVMSSLPASVYRTLEKVAKGGESTGHPFDEISEAYTGRPYEEWKARAANGSDADKALLAKVENAAAKDGISADAPSSAVPYQTTKTARTAVGEALQSARKHFQQTGLGNNAVRTLQQLYGSMTDSMKASVAGDPALAAKFEKANALTRERTSTFVDPKTIRKLIYADDPGKVIGSVMRSGADADVDALRAALEADKTGQSLARAQRGAMDYILRKSTKTASSDLPAGIRPEAIDYDTALRNARSSTALRTLLGDDKYVTFLKDLDGKRLAQRTPDNIILDNQLTKIAKAETPEKAAKLAGYDAGSDSGVQAAEQKARAVAGVRGRMQSPRATEQGPQRVAGQLASELEPSKIVERAAGSPEYTDKLLNVLDKHPEAKALREALGQRIFRNASDGAMVRGAFGSSDGVFDVEKFQSEYAKSRPSLARILPDANLAAMDKFNDALNRYALSKGVGGSAGMSGRFMAMRQIFGVLSMARGALSGSPTTFALGAAASFGPRAWMEIATRPQLANAMTKVLSSGNKALQATGAVGEINKAGEDAARNPSSENSSSSGRGFQKP